MALMTLEPIPKNFAWQGREPPKPLDDPRDLNNEIYKEARKFYGDELYNLVKRCLSGWPVARISAEELFKNILKRTRGPSANPSRTTAPMYMSKLGPGEKMLYKGSPYTGLLA